MGKTSFWEMFREIYFNNTNTVTYFRENKDNLKVSFLCNP